MNEEVEYLERLGSQLELHLVELSRMKELVRQERDRVKLRLSVVRSSTENG